MTMKSGTKVLLGAVIGGTTAVLTDLGIRYWADNEAKPATTAGGDPTMPFVYDNAPIIGGLAGIVASGLSYFVFKDWGPVIAGAMVAAFAGATPALDEWTIRAREEKDAAETPAGEPPGSLRGLTGRGAHGALGAGLRDLGGARSHAAVGAGSLAR